MKVLITGGAGFLGSHLVDALMDKGHEVVVLDNLRRGNLENLRVHLNHRLFTFFQGDIRDEEAILGAMRGVRVVYHLAAQSNVMGAHEDVDYSFSTNVTGTMTVLKAAAQHQVDRVIFASSREVYGEQATIPVGEDAPLNAKNLYGASKLSAESYCRAWANASGVDCVVLRFANIYGPRDSGRVIPLWLQQAENGDELVLYGGKQILDFIWVGTAVEALVKAAHSVANGPINVGSGQGTPLPELAERIKDLVRSTSAIRVELPRGPEVSRFVADVHKMQEHLQIAPPADSLSYLHLLMTAASDRDGAQAS